MFNNLKNNMLNKAWWLAFISALIVLCKIWGIDITDYIGKDWVNTVNSIATIGLLLGISSNTTLQTIGKPNQVEDKTIEAENSVIETKAEDSTTAINNEVTENSNQITTLSDAKLEQIKTILQQ